MLYEIIGKPLFNFFIPCFIIFSVLLFNMSTSYDQKAYRVTMNGQEIFLKYHESYRRVLIPNILDARAGNYGFYNIEEPVNNIDNNDKYILDIKKYSVYYSYDKTQAKGEASWFFLDNRVYKEEKLDNTKLVITRKNVTIYDGKYIENISKYISGPGRYFFQLYIYQKDNFYTSLNMRISFNVIIGGGSHE